MVFSRARESFEENAHAMAAGLREDLELIYVAEGKWTARRTETVVLSLVGYYVR